MHSPVSVSHAAAFCSDRQFCIEVFARRASLCSFLRTVLPSSFAIGSGCSQAAAAPIVPVDILTQGGFALCASWVREPQCAWVHIRCPKSLFHDVSVNSLSSVAEQCVCAISNLLKHCKDAECHWTIEAPSRSTFWSTWLGKHLLSTAVDVSLSSFGSRARGCIRFASSAPSCLADLPSPYPAPVKSSSEVVLGRLYRSLASAMLTFLNVQAPTVPPLEAAQIGTGGQPRKASFSPVPEFKLFMQVPLQCVPKLDGKSRLVEPLSTQGVVVPVGSKLLQPLASLTAVSGNGGGSNSCQPAMSALSSASSSPGVATPFPTSASCRASRCPFGLGGVALGLRGSDTGASTGPFRATGCVDVPGQCVERALATSVQAVEGEVSKQPSEGALATSIQVEGEVSEQPFEGALATSVQVVGRNCVAEGPRCPTKVSCATSVSTDVVAPVPSEGPRCPTKVSCATSVSTDVEAPVPSTRAEGRGKPQRPSEGALETSVQVVGCEAELLASSPSFSLGAESLLHIFDLLPAEVPARGVRDAREKGWSAGAYSHGTLCGLRRSTRVFPAVVKAAVAWLRAKVPAATFSAIAIYSNVCAPMHKDKNNMEGSLNYVVPLTTFRERGIWVQCSKGQVTKDYTSWQGAWQDLTGV